MSRYITVTAEFDPTGNIRPISINLDGRTLSIDRIISSCPAASLKHGGQGIRYTCRIVGKTVYLFNDNGLWFLETQ